MGIIDNKQIEKIKLFQLAKHFIRKDFSFEFTPDHFSYPVDKEKLYEFFNNTEEKLLSVTVPVKYDGTELNSWLQGRLLEVEWSTSESLILRMVNLPNIMKPYDQIVQIKLGKSIPLNFYDFQTSFMISIKNFVSWTNSQEKNIVDLLRLGCAQTELATKESTAFNKLLSYSEYVEKYSAPQGGHYICSNFSLENFLFDDARITRYCTAVDDIESLDFALTYRNTDIINAMKGGNDSLKRYLQNCDVIKVKKKELSVILSWKYPFRLRGFLTFLIKLESSYPADLVINSEINRALKRRNDVPISNCLTVLEELKNSPKDIESAIVSLENTFAKRFNNDISAIEKAKAYDRALARDKQELIQRWNNEDFVRYSDAYSRLIGTNACKNIAAFVKIMRESTFLEDLPSHLIQRSDAGGKAFLCFPFIFKTLFMSPEFEDPSNPYRGNFYDFTFAQYFCNATWDGKREIKSMDDRKNRLKDIYDIYLGLNFGLEGLSVYFACLPAVYEKFQIIIKFLADVEAFALKKILNSGMLSEYLSNGVDNYKLFPDNHWLLIKEYQNKKLEEEKRKLEQEKRDLELKSQTQKEIFTNLNHSIKNLVMSVTKTLDRAKQEELSLPVRRMINRASQGADLISSIARAISFSYRDSENLWKKDINVSTSASPMDQIILSALFHSVPNILSGENLANYRYECERYFPRKEDFELAEKEWYQASNASLKQEWINKFLFPLQLNLDASLKNLLIDDEHATTTNFFILFNEIFLNTIKALAYVDKDARECKVYMTFYNNTLIFDLINTAASDRTQNKNGFGHILIENYRKMFNIEIFDETFEPAEKKYKLHFELPLV